MPNPEIRTHMCVVDGDVKVYVDSMDRNAKACKTLNRDGEWEEVGLYESRKDMGFTFSADRAKEVLVELLEDAK